VLLQHGLVQRRGDDVTVRSRDYDARPVNRRHHCVSDDVKQLDTSSTAAANDDAHSSTQLATSRLNNAPVPTTYPRPYYTVNHKKLDILFLTITLANLNKFLQFLYHFNREEMLHATVVKFPPHLNCVCTLLRKLK